MACPPRGPATAVSAPHRPRPDSKGTSPSGGGRALGAAWRPISHFWRFLALFGPCSRGGGSTLGAGPAALACLPAWPGRRRGPGLFRELAPCRSATPPRPSRSHSRSFSRTPAGGRFGRGPGCCPPPPPARHSMSAADPPSPPGAARICLAGGPLLPGCPSVRPARGPGACLLGCGQRRLSQAATRSPPRFWWRRGGGGIWHLGGRFARAARVILTLFSITIQE